MNFLVNFMEGKGKNGADAFKQLEPRLHEDESRQIVTNFTELFHDS